MLSKKITVDCGDCEYRKTCVAGDKCHNAIIANRVSFMEYFQYDADKKRASLLNRINTRIKLRKAGFD